MLIVVQSTTLVIQSHNLSFQALLFVHFILVTKFDHNEKKTYLSFICNASLWRYSWLYYSQSNSFLIAQSWFKFRRANIMILRLYFQELCLCIRHSLREINSMSEFTGLMHEVGVGLRILAISLKISLRSRSI